MSSNKKRRELNRAIEEHEIAKLASSSNSAFNAAVWKAGAEKLQADNDQLRSELATIKAENESLKRDAERYRWLKSQEPSKADGYAIGYFDTCGVDAWRMATKDLDQAIDTAIAKGEHE